MEMHVHWVNATRTGLEKRRVEMEYEEFLLDHFGSAANAFVCKQEFHRQYEPVRHPWLIAVIKAHDLATRKLLPSEKQLAHFKCSFMDD